MNEEVKEIVDKYIDNEDLRKFSNHYYSDYVYTENVKPKEELSRMTMGIDATLNYYMEQESLADQDIEVMERRIAEYELAVFKIFSEEIDSNFAYSAYELQKLIENIYEYYRKLKSIEMIKRTTNSRIGYTF